jgi:hypothetical protein
MTVGAFVGFVVAFHAAIGWLMRRMEEPDDEWEKHPRSYR